MNSKVKEKWVAALRSGKFEQTTLRLRRGISRNTSYCCLGVLCELYRQETGDGEWDGNYFCPSASNRDSRELPLSVMQWAELENTNPRIDFDNFGLTSLAELNDDGRSFTEIAAIIEGKI